MSQVNFFNTNGALIDTPKGPQYGGVSAWQGIRYLGSDTYLLCGTTNPNPNAGYGLIYVGDINCIDGKFYYLNIPVNVGIATSVYGPNYDQNTGIYTFVGSYTNYLYEVKGFVYSGTLDKDSLNNPDNFSYPSVNTQYETNFLHSNSNGLVVGNSGDKISTISYIYDINNLSQIKKQIQFPNSITTTTYGIWFNGGTSYTLVGGYSPNFVPIESIYLPNGIIRPIGSAFIVDYNSETNTFSNWTTIDFQNNISSFLTHFEGIYGNEDGTYSINADVINLSVSPIPQGYFLTISRNDKNEFETNFENWVKLNYSSKGTSSSNSVANNKVVGLFIGEQNVSYQCEILPSINIFNDLLNNNEYVIFKGALAGGPCKFVSPQQNVDKLYNFEAKPIFGPYAALTTYLIITRHKGLLVPKNTQYVNIQIVFYINNEKNILEVGTGVINDNQIKFLTTETSTLIGFIEYKNNKFTINRFSTPPDLIFIDSTDIQKITTLQFEEETGIKV